jgi:hypothetical protein
MGVRRRAWGGGSELMGEGVSEVDGGGGIMSYDQRETCGL